MLTIIAIHVVFNVRVVMLFHVLVALKDTHYHRITGTVTLSLTN